MFVAYVFEINFLFQILTVQLCQLCSILEVHEGCELTLSSFPYQRIRNACTCRCSFVLQGCHLSKHWVKVASTSFIPFLSLQLLMEISTVAFANSNICESSFISRLLQFMKQQLMAAGCVFCSRSVDALILPGRRENILWGLQSCTDAAWLNGTRCPLILNVRRCLLF